jgi:hypothetical protein
MNQFGRLLFGGNFNVFFSSLSNSSPHVVDIFLDRTDSTGTSALRIKEECGSGTQYDGLYVQAGVYKLPEPSAELSIFSSCENKDLSRFQTTYDTVKNIAQFNMHLDDSTGNTSNIVFENRQIMPKQDFWDLGTESFPFNNVYTNNIYSNNGILFTPADSATIYSTTPAAGTTYYCSNCSGSGVTGRIVSYIGSLWRRLSFD